MQRSRVEDEAGEQRRKQDEDKAKVTQRCTHMDEDGGNRWSSQGDEAEEKQGSSDEEEHEEMQSRGDQNEAEHKQPRADEDKECPGLDDPGHNKKERPKRNDHNQPKQRQRDWTPRTGSSGAGQAARTAAPRTGASRDQWLWTPPGLEHAGQNKQQAPRGSAEAATRTRPWRCSEAEKRTSQGGSGQTKMRTRPR